MRITLCARSKILQLLEPGKFFRIKVTTLPSAGKHVDLLVNEEADEGDCIICSEPKVVADLKTATLLADQVVDYSYDNDEFIISNRGNEACTPLE